MVLSGWKSIAKYLDCGIRTAQRWEQGGLPIRRPVRGIRGMVVADSEDLDSWRLNSAFWRTQDFELLSNLEHSRQLRAEVHQARKTLRLKMQVLRNEVAALQGKMKQ